MINLSLNYGGFLFRKNAERWNWDEMVNIKKPWKQKPVRKKLTRSCTAVRWVPEKAGISSNKMIGGRNF
jgi:hypothetical protein